MQKGWLFCFALAAGLFGAGVIWAGLINPIIDLSGFSISTVLELTVALAALATAVIAFQASRTWKAQIRAQYDLDLVRRIALQISKCEESACRLMAGALLSIQNAENQDDSLFWSKIADDIRVKAEDSMDILAGLKALELEYRAWWGDPPEDVFLPIKLLLHWVIGCCTSLHPVPDSDSQNYWLALPLQTRLNGYLHDAEKLGIATDAEITANIDIVHKAFHPAKSHLLEKMKL